MIFRFFIVTILFFIPAISLAQVVITEIMYDPKDTDANAGGEWVEVQNVGSVAIDLTQWIFFENNTNHGITADGATQIPPGAYAVISRDITVFKNYFISFSGTLFKASFSLNDGENLAMKVDKDDLINDTNSITYTSEWGAKNDGNSLQKSQTGWTAVLPTPGSAPNIQITENNSSPEEVSQSALLPQQNSTNGNVVEPKQAITVDAGPSKQTAIVGADSTFKGIVYGLEGDVIPNARLMWNFGDGSVRDGGSVSHAYQYPGEYIVSLEGSSGGYSSSDRIVVTVVLAQIFINEIGLPENFFISVKNDTKHELNIGGWIVRSGVTNFTIPANTFILPLKTLRLSPSVTKLSYNNDVALLYPNGNTASIYKEIIMASPTNPEETISNQSQKISNDVPTAYVVDKNKKEKKSALIPIAEESQIAAVSSANLNENSVTKWLFALLGFLALSLGSLFLIFRAQNTKNSHVDPTADEFTILEEKL